MPTIYFDLMLKGREWLAHPKHLDIDPDAPDAQPACDYDSDNRS
jgi:sulfide:quinone oxidoreductase